MAFQSVVCATLRFSSGLPTPGSLDGRVVLIVQRGELSDAAACIDRAVSLNPNLASARTHSGWIKLWLGEPDLAIEHFAYAMRLSPIDPHLHHLLQGTAMLPPCAPTPRRPRTPAPPLARSTSSLMPVDARLAAEFKGYAELANPKQLTIAAVQALLRPDEG